MKYKIMMCLSIILICIIGILMCCNTDSYEFKRYVIRQGDTFWEIAVRESNVNGDVRKTVHNIYKINGLRQDEDIYPGQVILIPVRK